MGIRKGTGRNKNRKRNSKSGKRVTVIRRKPYREKETIRTPQFKNWFGDWENNPDKASKVVDEDGRPKIVFHGSTYNFDEFKRDMIGRDSVDGLGFYFTSSRNDADTYKYNRWEISKQRQKQLEEIMRDWDMEGKYRDLDEDEKVKKAFEELGVEPVTLEVYLNIRNPAIINPIYVDRETGEWRNGSTTFSTDNGSGKKFVGAVDRVADRMGYDPKKIKKDLRINDSNFTIPLHKVQRRLADSYYDSHTSQEVFTELVKEMGYDGVIRKRADISPELDGTGGLGAKKDWEGNRPFPTTHYIIFEPNQVKSTEATQFLTYDHRIHKSIHDEMGKKKRRKS